ncbi:MAG: MGMT family protein [Spirochaetota bacterium]
MTDFSRRCISVITSIPKGSVLSYGDVAFLAGSPHAARQVARLLHAASRRYDLPWHRVVSKQGEILLPPGKGYELQCSLLQEEGVIVDEHGVIDMRQFQWTPHL